LVLPWAAVSLYQRYIENPWTRDGQVRANIVGIAPRISGPIIDVAVHDNQEVKKGDLLFEIDPADFQAQVNLSTGQVLNAEANLTRLGCVSSGRLGQCQHRPVTLNQSDY
jgi:multidrug resistance efflux pump